MFSIFFLLLLWLCSACWSFLFFGCFDYQFRGKVLCCPISFTICISILKFLFSWIFAFCYFLLLCLRFDWRVVLCFLHYCLFCALSCQWPIPYIFVCMMWSWIVTLYFSSLFCVLALTVLWSVIHSFVLKVCIAGKFVSFVDSDATVCSLSSCKKCVFIIPVLVARSSRSLSSLICANRWSRQSCACGVA